MQNRTPSSTLARTAAAWAVALAGIATIVAGPMARAESSEQIALVQRALERLPYYGVFDFAAFSIDRGTVTLQGFAYRGTLKADAVRAVKRVAGVDEVVDRIEVLPASNDDDRVRWATYYAIYADDFLSRYTPGGPYTARYELLTLARFPGMQPLGRYPIHIVVKGRRTMLLGVVNTEADKTVAGTQARQIPGVFGVENELMVR